VREAAKGPERKTAWLSPGRKKKNLLVRPTCPRGSKQKARRPTPGEAQANGSGSLHILIPKDRKYPKWRVERGLVRALKGKGQSSLPHPLAPGYWVVLEED